ncbi:MAG: polysaccharide deacetylase family protein [Clostridia bacterium]|nr:polysaccharide deacetylase family protein [Clostridia bacterium]
MKRIISVVLLIMLLISLSSCKFEAISRMFGINPPDESSQGESSSNETSTDEEAPYETIEESSLEESSDTEETSTVENTTTEETSTEEESSSEEQISDGTDKTEYIPKENEDGTKYLYRNVELLKPVFTPYYHNYSSAVSLTFDDGYSTETGYNVSKVFNKYGFKGTVMMSACFIDGDEYVIEQWQDVLSYGYLDVGAHGWDHLDPRLITDTEIFEKETLEAVNFLKQTFKNQRVLTFATPYAMISNQYEDYLRKCSISNRLESGGSTNTLFGENVNLYRVNSVSFNKGVTSSAVITNISNSASQGKWTTVLMHSVLDVPQYSTDVSLEEFQTLCEFLSLRNDIWVASFEEASIYAMQLANAKMNYTSCDKSSISFNITCDLDKSIYNIPMSAKIYLPKFTDTVYSELNGVKTSYVIQKDAEGRFITVLDIPVNGEEVVIYLGGNSWCDNGCEEHHYINIETATATCTEPGYTLRECEYCQNQYKYRYTLIKGHTLDGEEKTVKEPTEYTVGSKTVQCSVCKEEIIKELRYSGE